MIAARRFQCHVRQHVRANHAPHLVNRAVAVAVVAVVVKAVVEAAVAPAEVAHRAVVVHKVAVAPQVAVVRKAVVAPVAVVHKAAVAAVVVKVVVVAEAVRLKAAHRAQHQVAHAGVIASSLFKERSPGFGRAFFLCQRRSNVCITIRILRFSFAKTVGGI